MLTILRLPWAPVPLLLACLPAQGNYFVGPAAVGALNMPAGFSNFSPTLSGNERYLVFASTRPGGLGGYDLWETTRPAVGAPWNPPVALAGLNSSAADYEPHLSFDSLTLYFVSTRAGGLGTSDIWFSTRPNPGAPWGSPQNLGAPVNGPGIANDDPCLTEDGLTLFYTSGGAGGGDLWTASRPSVNGAFGAPAPFAPANSAGLDHSPVVEGNGDVVWFASDRAGGTHGSSDFYMITRDPVTAVYSAPVGIGDLNTADWDSNAARGRSTGAMYVSQFNAGLGIIIVVCNSLSMVALPGNSRVDMDPEAIAAPSRTVWSRDYQQSVTAASETITIARWIQASPGGRADALVASFAGQSPAIPASLLVPGGLGALFLGGAATTLQLTIVPPLTAVPIEVYTLTGFSHPMFIGLTLHLQGADLDFGSGLLMLSQPATFTLTP